jgi:hypothetical protein
VAEEEIKLVDVLDVVCNSSQIRGRIAIRSAPGASEPEYLSTALLSAMRRLVLATSFDAPDGCENVSRS